jgi:outer membrane protein OmpA-like peptidoglycan-associated protein
MPGRRRSTYHTPALAVLAAVAALAVLGGSSAAYAEAAVEVGAKIRGTGPSDRPAILLKARKAVRAVEVRVEPMMGEPTVVKIPALKAGESRSVPYDQKPGRAFHRAVVSWAGAEAPVEVAFSSVMAWPIDVRVGPGDIDLPSGRFVVHVSGGVAKVQAVFLGEEGRETGRTEVQVPNGMAAKVELKPPADAPVVGIVLTVSDPEGFAKVVKLLPYHVEIPHDEVSFEFGKADILPPEEAKLERTLAEVRAAAARVGPEFRVRLYVAGYTDTVGTRESNQELSNRRAAAIAGWLRTHGLEIPVCSQGFGEDVLAVMTRDETPEAGNRRTVHLLAVQPPSSAGFPRKDWRCE